MFYCPFLAITGAYAYLSPCHWGGGEAQGGLLAFVYVIGQPVPTFRPMKTLENGTNTIYYLSTNESYFNTLLSTFLDIILFFSWQTTLLLRLYIEHSATAIQGCY